MRDVIVSSSRGHSPPLAVPLGENPSQPTRRLMFRASARHAARALGYADPASRALIAAGAYAAVALTVWRNEEPDDDSHLETWVALLDLRSRNVDTRGFKILYPPEVRRRRAPWFVRGTCV